MAFMNQEIKGKIQAELKKVVPADWKWSLSVHHHSSITLTISAAPVDIMAEYNKHVTANWADRRPGETYHPEQYTQLNEYYLENQFSGELLETFKRIRKALNTGNWDRSDAQTDYFDVGFYAYIHVGRWDKPFQVIPAKIAPKSAPIPGDAEYEALKARIVQLEAMKVSSAIQ